ncbi:hypothetical protein AGMMS49921_10730 [Endomicrobiia bacterium]|nr:hypothetical protein AGMMS49921_10730 [Endomicrobiia bacterium]
MVRLFQRCDTGNDDNDSNDGYDVGKMLRERTFKESWSKVCICLAGGKMEARAIIFKYTI